VHDLWADHAPAISVLLIAIGAVIWFIARNASEIARPHRQQSRYLGAALFLLGIAWGIFGVDIVGHANFAWVVAPGMALLCIGWGLILQAER
jgi:hypothetical protein